MKSILAALGLLLTATIGAEATVTACATVLDTPDGFLNVRTGPGTEFPVRTRVFPGDLLEVGSETCQDLGNGRTLCNDRWTRVISIIRNDLGDERRTEGWVAERFVRWHPCVPDDVDRAEETGPEPVERFAGKILEECRSLDPSLTAFHQGAIVPLRLFGRDAFLVDHRNVCGRVIKGANCTTDGCPVTILSATGETLIEVTFLDRIVQLDKDGHLMAIFGTLREVSKGCPVKVGPCRVSLRPSARGWDWTYHSSDQRR